MLSKQSHVLVMGELQEVNIIEEYFSASKLHADSIHVQVAQVRKINIDKEENVLNFYESNPFVKHAPS